MLEWYAPDRRWATSDWDITPSDLDRLEASLEKELVNAKVGRRSIETQGLYRQYMPARWKGFRLIVVNGFYETAAELFPDKNIDPDEWKKKREIAFGGGCMYWRAAYVVEQNSFMKLRGGMKVLCNAPK